MRRGEILNLKWENIDFKLNFIELLETKSGKSRKIPISPVLNNVFNNIPGTSEFVFVNQKNKSTVCRLKKIISYYN